MKPPNNTATECWTRFEPHARIRRQHSKNCTLAGSTHYYRFFVLVAALATYRSGDWERARQHCDEWIEKTSTSKEVFYLTAHYLVVQSMAEQRLGNHEQAQTSLKKAAEIIAEKWPNAPEGVNERWPEWQTYEVLRREAELLIANEMGGAEQR